MVGPSLDMVVLRINKFMSHFKCNRVVISLNKLNWMWLKADVHNVLVYSVVFLAKSLPLFRSLFDRSRYAAVHRDLIVVQVENEWLRRHWKAESWGLCNKTSNNKALEKMFIEHVQPTFIIIDVTAGYVLVLPVRWMDAHLFTNAPSPHPPSSWKLQNAGIPVKEVALTVESILGCFYTAFGDSFLIVHGYQNQRWHSVSAIHLPNDNLPGHQKHR